MSLRLLAIALLTSSLGAAITVDTTSVLREIPPGIGGTNIRAHTPRLAVEPSIQADLTRSGVRRVRMLAYPDSHRPEHGQDLFDRDVKAVLAAGAEPLFITYIEPGLDYRKADGSPGGSVETNLVYQVLHYAAPPFNLETQIWEIGNEPDYTIDYKVASVAEYTDLFNRCHEALVEAGLRDQVRLAGPAVIGPYRYVGRDWFNTSLIEGVLTECAHAVDIVSYHHYAPGEDRLPSPEALLNHPELDALEQTGKIPETPLGPEDFGMSALLARMAEAGLAREPVGVALTEHNSIGYHHSLYQALYNLIVTQFHLRNPRSELTASYVFDAAPPLDGHGHYHRDGRPDYNHHALYLRNRLRGDELLEASHGTRSNAHGNPRLLTVATRDRHHLYLEVINRSPEAIEEPIRWIGTAPEGTPEVFRLDAQTLPANPVVRESFDGFPAFSTTVLRWQRRPAGPDG